MDYKITVLNFELCPFARQFRFILDHQRVIYSLVKDNNYHKNYINNLSFNFQPQYFIDGKQFSGWGSFLHFYFSEIAANRDNTFINLEVLHLGEYFNAVFYNKVFRPIFIEKILSLLNYQEPNSRILIEAKRNLRQYLNLWEEKITENEFFSGENHNESDLIAASYISILDYIEAINWQNLPHLKAWYGIIKSKPYIQKILAERFKSLTPPKWYEDPDF